MSIQSLPRDAVARIKRLERLLDASRLLNSTLELTEITTFVLRIVQEEVPVDRCTLFVVDPRQKLLRSFIAQGIEKFEITMPIGEGLAGSVALTGEPLDVQDVYEDGRFQAQFDKHLGYRTENVFCMPIFNREGVVTGVLQLLNRLRPLDSDDTEFLSSICTYIGLAVHNAWVHRELLESRNLEEELRIVRDRVAQSEKRMAMAELVAGIIHEMRNPLSVALGQCTLFREQDSLDATTISRISKIEGGIDRALKVAKNFLNFARESGNERAPIDINSIIRQTVDLLAYDFRKSGVTAQLQLTSLPLARVDSGSIQQVLLNIMKNAQVAACEMKRDGKVAVRSSYHAARRTIRVELTDDGAGIPTSLRPRIFEPFFTTKERGAGTGLGLAVAKRIMEQHQGTLTFESHEGHGTTFIMELPLEETFPNKN